MSNKPASSAADIAVTDAAEIDATTDAAVLDAIKDDPVLQGHGALEDPDLSGSTAASWTGTGGPDPGGVVGPADLDQQADDAANGGRLQQAAADAADQMQQAAGGAVDQAQHAVGPVAEQAQQVVGPVVDQAQQVAGQVMDTARAQTTNRLSMAKDQLATTIGAVAEAMRQSSQGLRDQDQGAMAGYAGQAADRLEEAATYLRQRDVPDLVDEVEGVARRQPTLFIGAAFGLGLLAARFLKSSRQQAQQAQAAPSDSPERAFQETPWNDGASARTGMESAVTAARTRPASGRVAFRSDATQAERDPMTDETSGVAARRTPKRKRARA